MKVLLIAASIYFIQSIGVTEMKDDMKKVIENMKKQPEQLKKNFGTQRPLKHKKGK